MLILSARGLPRSMTEQRLQELLTAHGAIRNLKMARDLFSGDCKGFAEFEMEGHHARAAMAALDGKTIDGATVRLGLKKDDRRRR